MLFLEKVLPANPMSMAASLALLGGLVAASGACESFDTDAEPETETASSPVVNGTEVIGYPSTGGLLRGAQENTAFMQCSGTLIGCDTFVTAAHCVCDDPRVCSQKTPASELFVYFQNSGTYQVSEVHVEPRYSFPQFGDVAVLRLTEPGTGVTPTPIARLDPPTNAAMTIVGYGLTFNGNNDSGIKREGELKRTSCGGFSNESHLCFDPNESPTVSCSGDSGGPNFYNIDGTLHLAGVVSGGGIEGDCTGGQKFATNVSNFTVFVESVSGPLGGTCGPLPTAADADTYVVTASGSAAGGSYTIDVPAKSTELRVGVNAMFGQTNASVAHSDSALSDASCQINTSQAGMCTITSPPPGTYTVTVSSSRDFQLSMTALSGAPEAVPDSYEATTEELLEVAVEEGVLANDLSGLNIEMTAIFETLPTNGRLSLETNGQFRYISNPEFTGLDTFSYRVDEGGYLSAPVSVEVMVTEAGGCFCQSSGRGNGAAIILLLAVILAIAPRKRRTF